MLKIDMKPLRESFLQVEYPRADVLDLELEEAIRRVYLAWTQAEFNQTLARETMNSIPKELIVIAKKEAGRRKRRIN